MFALLFALIDVCVNTLLLGHWSSNRGPAEVGDAVRVDGVLQDQDGAPVNLAEELRKPGLLVLIFYPAADTPACTMQACSIRDTFERVQAAGPETRVYGIGAGSPEALKQFHSTRRLPYQLLHDPGGVLASALRLPRIGGVTPRAAYILEFGRVVWRRLAPPVNRAGEDLSTAVAQLRETKGTAAAMP